jgi:hypothetical protein
MSIDSQIRLATPDWSTLDLEWTVWLAKQSVSFAKLHGLDSDNNLKLIRGGGGFWRGTGQTHSALWEDFQDCLMILPPDGAMSYGVIRAGGGEFTVVAADKIALVQDKHNKVIARTRDYLGWSDGPGIFFLDIDVAKDPNHASPKTLDEILEILFRVAPVLEECTYCVIPSASSFLYRMSDGAELKGPGGWHVYFPVLNATEIPEIGKRLEQLLWIAGDGHIESSEDGRALVRTVIDCCVWQPERLDFAGGCECGEGVEQRRKVPYKSNLGGILELAVLPKASEELFQALVEAKKEETAPELAAKKEAWMAGQVGKYKQTYPGATTNDLREFRTRLDKLGESQVLPAGYTMYSKKYGEVTQETILQDISKFLKTDYLPPNEPHYRDGKDYCARLFCEDGHVWITSFAHGKPTRFYLLERPDEKKPETPAEMDLRHARDDLAGLIAQRDKLREQLEQAKAHGNKKEVRETEKALDALDPKITKAKQKIEKLEIKAQRSTCLQPDKPLIEIKDDSLDADTDRICEILREDATIFERGGMIVKVNGGEINRVDPIWLRKHLSGKIAFVSNEKTVNCSKVYAETVCAMSGERGLPPLKGVITQPTITKSGRIIDTTGYDHETGLYIHLKEQFPWEAIPDNPSDADVRLATEQVMAPIKLYPFVDPADRATAVTGFLSVVIRPWLFTCPAIATDSPTKGSGKTKLAVSILHAAPGRTKFLGPVGNDEEMGKQLIGLQLEGCCAVVFDEMTYLGFKSLNGFLTNSTFGGRILKTNDMPDLPTNMLLMFTGINLAIQDDSNRRFLRCRIDPKVEDPTKLRFAFDPVRYTREHRWEIVRATLLLHRAAIVRNIPKPDPLPSFEEWSDMVRPVITLMREIGGVELRDPCETIDNSRQDDPEYLRTIAFIHAVREKFKGKRWSVHELVKESQINDPLKSALLEVGAKNGFIDATRVGKWLAKRKDTITDGYLIRKPENDRFKDGKPAWEIVDTEAEHAVALPANVIPFSESQAAPPAGIPSGTCPKGAFGADIDLFDECDSCSQYDACAKAFSARP